MLYNFITYSIIYSTILYHITCFATFSKVNVSELVSALWFNQWPQRKGVCFCHGSRSFQKSFLFPVRASQLATSFPWLWGCGEERGKNSGNKEAAAAAAAVRGLWFGPAVGEGGRRERKTHVSKHRRRVKTQGRDLFGGGRLERRLKSLCVCVRARQSAILVAWINIWVGGGTPQRGLIFSGCVFAHKQMGISALVCRCLCVRRCVSVRVHVLH